jgi:hypothetical protein
MVIHNIEKASAHGGAQNKESTPVERGIGLPQEEAWVHFKIPNPKSQIPNSKLQITNKFQIAIFNDQNNGANVKIRREPLNSEPVAADD